MADAGEATVTARRPARAAARAASRPAPVLDGPPVKARTAPRLYLWASIAGRGRCCSQRCGWLRKSSAPQVATAVLVHADIGQDDLAAEVASRQEDMAGFQPGEGDRKVRPERTGSRRAALSGDAGREIDSHQGSARGGAIPGESGMVGREITRQTGAEQRVHDAASRVRAKFVDRARPATGNRRRRAWHPSRTAQAKHVDRDRDAGGREFGRDDIAVAAIVARTTQDVPGLDRRKSRQNLASKPRGRHAA